MWSGDDIHFMKLAIEEAEQADRRDEVPIGAILLGGTTGLGGLRSLVVQGHALERIAKQVLQPV